MNEVSFSISNHANKLLGEALSNNEFGDILLLSDSKSLKDEAGIRVHSSILTQCFPNIADLLRDNVTGPGERLRVVTVAGVGEEELMDVIRLVYTGVTRVTEQRRGEVMAVAKMLGLQNIETFSETQEDEEDSYMEHEGTDLDWPDVKEEETIKPSGPQIIKITKKETEKLDLNDIKTRTCEACGKVYKARRAMLNHFRLYHTEKLDLNDIKTRTCEACGKVYKARHVMLKHFRFYHTGEAGKERRERDLHTPRTCAECGKHFKTQSALANHYKAHHTDEKHTCDKCGFTTNRKSVLKLHHINKHEEHKYCCDQCSKTYPNKYLLDVHIRSEHEGILVKCSDCDFSSAHKHNVTKHYQSVHLKLKK